MNDQASKRFRQTAHMLMCSGIAACSAVTATTAAEPPAAPYDLWIKDGVIHDGTGGAPIDADILVRGDRIAYVGPVDDVNARRIIDAKGRIVAPGFIDTHSHGDPLADEFANFALQGVTSVLLGQDGSTPGSSKQAPLSLVFINWPRVQRRFMRTGF